MDPSVKFKDDFDNIVELVWKIHTGQLDSQFVSHHHSQLEISSLTVSSHMKVLRKELLRLRGKYPSTFSIDKEDIGQQLRYLWYQYMESYKGRDKDYLVRDHLLACTPWGMKAWYFQEVVGMSHSNDPEVECPHLHQTTLPVSDLRRYLLKLDPSFFIQDPPWPLSSLSPYEKYLIYLQYQAEKSIVEIAYIVQKDRGVVSRQLKQIHKKLRSLVDAPEDPR